ncbi:uncharacterized protein LOC115224746 isoform X2 [Octopus sinensis]|uniref:Uncharacterized protein LOC115224746 isoform X2 n=1 Tax=Octopus sinensis TaxID=2607531 RepID=A0A7E6FPW4_9MOLL|nr:uncharacterized protein LOC115224746 isoform X2 [Octopus sinensis]
MFTDSGTRSNPKMVQSSAMMNVINMESLSDWKYSYIFCYQDSASKTLILHAIESKKPQHVATVLHDVLHLVGFPNVVRSESSHVFVSRVLQEMRILWGPCSSGLNSTQQVDMSNYSREEEEEEENEAEDEDNGSMINNVYVLETLKNWMIQHNSSNWSLGVKLVQFQENSINQNANVDFVSSDKLLTELASIYMPFECLKSLKSNDELNQILHRTLTTGLEDLLSQLGVTPKRTVCCRSSTAKPQGKCTNGHVADKKFQFERRGVLRSDLGTPACCNRKPCVTNEVSSVKEISESRLDGSVLGRSIIQDSDTSSRTAAVTNDSPAQDFSPNSIHSTHSDFHTTGIKSQLDRSAASGALEKPSAVIVDVSSNCPDRHLHLHHHHHHHHLHRYSRPSSPRSQQHERFWEALNSDGEYQCDLSRHSDRCTKDLSCKSKCVRDIIRFMELQSCQSSKNKISLTADKKLQNQSLDDSANSSLDGDSGPSQMLSQSISETPVQVTTLPTLNMSNSPVCVADTGDRTPDQDWVSCGQIATHSCLDIGQPSLDNRIDNETPVQTALHVQQISAPTDVWNEDENNCAKNFTEGALNREETALNCAENTSSQTSRNNPTSPSVNIGERCFVYSTKRGSAKAFVSLSRSSSLTEINTPMTCISVPPCSIPEIQNPVDSSTVENSDKFQDSQCLLKVQDIVKKLEISNAKCSDCEDFKKNRKIPERASNIGNIIKQLESFAGPHPKWRTLRIIGQSCEDLNNLGKDCDVSSCASDGSIVSGNTSLSGDDETEEVELPNDLLVEKPDTGLVLSIDDQSSPDHRCLTWKDSNQLIDTTDNYDTDDVGHGDDDDDDDDNDDDIDADDDDAFTYTEELNQRINKVIYRLKSESDMPDYLKDEDFGECCEDSSIGGMSQNTTADEISMSQEAGFHGNGSTDADCADPVTPTNADPPQCFPSKLRTSPSCYNLNSYISTSYFCESSQDGAYVKPNICESFDEVSNSVPSDGDHVSLNHIHNNPNSVNLSTPSNRLEPLIQQRSSTCTTVIHTPSWYVPSYENPKQITNPNDNHSEMPFLTDIEQKIKQALQELESVDFCRHLTFDSLCPTSVLFNEGSGAKPECISFPQCKQCECDGASHCQKCNYALPHQLQDHCYLYCQLCSLFNKRLVATQEQFHYQVYEKRTILRGKSFYAIETKPYCESCYVNTLEKCSVCSKPVIDRLLRATGKPYHPSCFTCVVCGKSLDGVPFTVDATNQIHCIDDFHKKFAPRCCVCQLPIMPDPGKEETVRVVAMDRSFHVHCYCCEDCGMLLSSEAEGRGCYPLDDHILCKICNAKRIQALTTKMTTEL